MDSIYSISAIARRAEAARKSGKKVYDGTIGSMLDDNGKLVTLPSVVYSFTHAELLNFGYSPIDGFPEYKSNAVDWILKKHTKEAKENHTLFTFATLGGTGALFMGFKYAQQFGLEVLIPDLCRPCYVDLLNGAVCFYKKYRLLDEEGHFNLDSIADIVAEDKEKFKGFLILINDPCQNPSGRTLSPEEVDKIADFCTRTNLMGGTKIRVLWDATYIDYSKKEPAWIAKICSKDAAPTNLVAFSGSKTFGIYGLRLGLLLGLLPKDAESLAADLTEIFSRIALQTYVSPDGLGMSVIQGLMRPKKAAAIRKELLPLADTLRKRGETMIAALKAHEIECLPYQEGFYLVAKTKNDPVAVASYLEKENIFLYPMQPEFLRISIAALLPGQAEKLAKALADLDAKEGLVPADSESKIIA